MDISNEYLKQRLTAIQEKLNVHHAGGRGLPSAMAGAEREAFLREFLQKVFPAHYRFSSGAITDSSGKISGQIDIAVEYPFTPSFPMPESEQRLLLAESVALVIEVKSDLSAQWNEVQTNVEKVKILKRDIKRKIGIGDRPGPTIPCVAVGYVGHKTIEGLVERLNSTPEQSRPDAALAIESGCFVSPNYRVSGVLGLYALYDLISSTMTGAVADRANLRAYISADRGSSK